MSAMCPGGPVMQESPALNWAIPHRLHVRQSAMIHACIHYSVVYTLSITTYTSLDKHIIPVLSTVTEL